MLRKVSMMVLASPVAWAAFTAHGQAVLPASIATPMDWTWGYEANSLPDAASIETPFGSPSSVAFTREGSGVTSESVGGGIYNATTIDSNAAATFWTPSSSAFTNLNSDKGYTLEWRVKVNDIDTTAIANPLTLAVDEARAGVDRFWIVSNNKDASGNFWVRMQGDLASGSVTTQINAATFNTYRMIVKHSVATLFVNNVGIGSLSLPRTNASNRIEFGDLTGAADASYSVDYLHAYDGAALRPVENLYQLETYLEPNSNRRFRTVFSQRNDAAPDTTSGYIGERMWYQVSNDGGATYDTIRPIIQKGGNYTASHPIDPVYAGLTDWRSSEWIPPLRMSNGEIIVPFQYSTLTADGNDYYNPYGTTTFTQAGVMIAKWNNTNTDIDWQLGSTLQINPTLSTRGLLEPAVVETNTPGRLLMVMRGSNENNASAAGRNWKAISNDYGRTWTPVSAMTYSDGSNFYSPSGMADVRKHKVNDKLYWFGNITPTNPNGNLPRYPLVMGEVDESTLGLVPGSLVTIASYTPGAPYFDTTQVQFSNFTVVEDPANHKYIVSFQRIDYGKPQSQWLPMTVEVPIAMGNAWMVDKGGSWATAGNWGSGVVPNGIGAVARLGGIATASRSVFIDSPVTLGSLTFNNVNGYNLTGAASLSMQAASGSASIGVIAGSHKINLPLTFVSDTVVSVSAGATLTLANPVIIKAGKTVTRTGTGSLLIQAPLTIESGGTLALASAPMSMSAMPLLAGGARIDVGAESLRISDWSAALPVEAALMNGYHNGSWAGEGVMTSAADGSHGLGWATNINGDVLVRFSAYGDADLSGTIDSTDFNRFLSGYGTLNGAIWANGDFNYDDKVNTADFNLLAGNFGAAPAALGSFVPEPTAAMALVAASLFAIRRGDRRPSL